MQAVHSRAAEKQDNVASDDRATDHREYRNAPNASQVKNIGSAECQACKKYEYDQ
jgi:hypothetical protein